MTKQAAWLDGVTWMCQTQMELTKVVMLAILGAVKASACLSSLDKYGSTCITKKTQGIVMVKGLRFDFFVSLN